MFHTNEADQIQGGPLLRLLPMSASSITAQRLQRSQQRFQSPAQHAIAQQPFVIAHQSSSASSIKVVPSQPATNFVSDVVDRCGPAVVKILTEHTRDGVEDLADLIDSLLGEGGVIGGDGHLFGDDEARKQRKKKKKTRVARGQGSGFLVDTPPC